ncbi:MAG: zinc ribbon domain-containing protein [Candidatus Hydrogenedentota bacterium]|jgi:putative FmdB family regulatory protein|uniref:Type I antifreeze protein n=1 Tax=Sumerlaea chitinivorans TaxID=2250252 RepID=A0A2Z4Y781_SUMC1|nr:Type I antifreeze protein [Candidatus Sumerlaea chitinivorans]RMH28256.1 MAG: zinc ribbon domain-containing protein [Candidatus Hydrogenedentota bacterium]
MPTYEYACTSCGEEFEYFQRMSEEPKKVCEKCGGRLERLVSSGSGLIFKGSGFYITDYKRSGNGSSKETKSGENKSAEKTDSSKSE